MHIREMNEAFKYPYKLNFLFWNYSLKYFIIIIFKSEFVRSEPLIRISDNFY